MGLDPAIHHFRKKMDVQVTSAFTRVFDALSPRMTESERFNSTGNGYRLPRIGSGL
jgi:hypothetical protein